MCESVPGWWWPGLTEFVGEGVRNTAHKVKKNVTVQKKNCAASKSIQIFSKTNKNQPEGCSLQTTQFAIKIAITILSLTSS